MKAALPLFGLALSALTLFGGCTTDLPVPAATQAWIHDTDGAVLTFSEGSSGATLLVRVERQEKTEKARHDGRRQRRHSGSLIYHTEASGQYGLHLAYSENTVLLQFRPAMADSDIELHTDAQEANETVTAAANSYAKLYDHVTINSQPYGRAFEGRLTRGSVSGASILSFNYSKSVGLVSFSTADGHHWQRRP